MPFVFGTSIAGRTVLLAVSPCTGSCTIDFCKEQFFHWVMKANALAGSVES
jgi:hypothetical protein